MPHLVHQEKRELKKIFKPASKKEKIYVFPHPLGIIVQSFYFLAYLVI